MILRGIVSEDGRWVELTEECVQRRASFCIGGTEPSDVVTSYKRLCLDKETRNAYYIILVGKCLGNR